MKKAVIIGILALVGYGIYKASKKKSVVNPSKGKYVKIGDNTANPDAMLVKPL